MRGVLKILFLWKIIKKKGGRDFPEKMGVLGGGMGKNRSFYGKLGGF